MTTNKPDDGPVRAHYLRDVDCTQLLLTARRGVVVAPLTDASRSATGAGAGIGLLATVFDVGGSDPAMALCKDDWVATQQLAIHGAGPLTEGPVVVDSRVERLGKRMVALTSTFWDAHGLDDPWEVAQAVDDTQAGTPTHPITRAGSGFITFARMTRAAAPHMNDYVPADWIGEVRRSPRVTVADSTLHDRMGIRVLDAASGTVEVDPSPYVVNSIGTVNGGSQAAMVEVAAEATQPGSVATDLQVQFLAQSRSGPLRTSVEIVREASDHSVVSVRLVDAGNDDHVVSLATVTLQRLDPRARD